MSNQSIHRCLAAWLLPCAAVAATSMSGPVTGYVTRSSSTELRAILGVPGALRYSDPLSLPEGTTRVRVAPGREFAWLERSSDAGILFLSGGLVDRFTAVSGAVAAADWVSFSPGAGSAVLFSASAG